MNDRASAAPPVHFIGTEERLLLQEYQEKRQQKHLSDATIDLAKLASAAAASATTTTVRPVSEEKPRPPQQPAVVGKRGSKQFLGHVFGGFMEKLRGKRDAAASGASSDEESQRKRKKSGDGKDKDKDNQDMNREGDSVAAVLKGSEGVMETYDQLVAAGFFSRASTPASASLAAATLQMGTETASGTTCRPSRDEVMESYQRLVASGFFASHAIQSTRQPAPGGMTKRPSTAVGSSGPPQWPLPSASGMQDERLLTPDRARRHASPFRSPGSASSRGTKRAAIDDDDENNGTGNTRVPSAVPTAGEVNSGAAQHLQQAKKKIRKTASTSHDIAVPKLRTASSSRRALLTRRSFSNAFAQSQAQAQQSQVAAPVPLVQQRGPLQPPQQREPNRLAKRVLGKLQVPDRGSSSSAASPPARGRRNVSESHHNPFMPTAPPAHRVLRPRRSAAEPLRVRPDANRGIPTVPDVPSKFTFGTDRENDGPWRGLRRGASAQPQET
jgi:hypothetical protein